MNKLPYKVKEIINMFALATMNDYEPLQIFNEIVYYEPSQFSNIKLINARSICCAKTSSLPNPNDFSKISAP